MFIYGHDIPHTMEQQQIPASEEKNVKTSVPKMIIGAAIALGLGILLMYLGLFNQCCGLGYLLVACVALYIPKMFGMTKMQYLIVFGVLFFLVTTAVGAFAVSKPMFENGSNVEDFNDSDFSNVSITLVGEGADVSVTYSGATAGTIKVDFYQVQLVTYQMISKTSSDDYKYTMTETSPGTYTANIPSVPSGFVYQFAFENTVGETTTTSDSVYYMGAINDSELQKFCLLYNAYNCGIIAVLFFLMLILTTISRKNLEKTRARMEAEGRLYPQGYGRCKECGSIVLPGETCCRKCGAYIDVPDELRHRKVDMVECSECGAEIPEDAKVCPKCGAVFDEEEEVVYVEKKDEDKKE